MNGRALALAGLVAGACAEHEPAATPGPACRALVEAATRASACDRALAGLAAIVSGDPDEAACVAAVRGWLRPPSPPRVRSVWESEPSLPDGPLSDAELAALAALVQPAHLAITPDVGAVPGIPPTSATVDGLALDRDADGVLTARLAPGRRTLVLRHAGARGQHCLDLRACETLAVTAHAAHLASHPRAHAGACDGPAVDAPDLGAAP